jgi:hypothetical protein
MLRAWRWTVLFLGLAPASGAATSAPLVDVLHPEGVVHGFLVLRSETGETLADGALLQTTRGDEVTSRVVFHFRDGSVHDETAVFSQRRSFRLLKDHLVQKGPSFPTTLEATFEVGKGTITVRSRKKDHEEEVATEPMKLPPDLSNGLLFTLLKNLRPGATKLESHFVAFTPKPRIVRLEISAAGEEAFTVGEASLKATHFVVHPELGGVTGLVAPLVGKDPPDFHVWISFADVPAFVKFEGALYPGGPNWRIELASPRWPDRPEGVRDPTKH